MLFQDSALKAVHTYWTGTPSKVLCLYGPPGCGKTECVNVVAKHLGRTVFDRSEEEPTGHTGSTGSSHTSSQSLRGPSCFILDEPDESLDLDNLLKTKTIVLTTDIYDGPLKHCRQKLQIVNLHRYTASEVCMILRQTYTVSSDVLSAIANVSGTDIRYAKILLDYALATAKAKRPGHKTIVTTKDLSFDLFADAENAFQKLPTSGLQSADFFLYLNLLQTNCVLRTKKVTKVLDAFSIVDVVESRQELPMQDLHTLVEYSLLDPLPGSLSMPKIPNPGKKMDLLKLAGDTRSNEYATCVERIACMNVPDRITKKHEWYHESADVRALRKAPYEKR